MRIWVAIIFALTLLPYSAFATSRDVAKAHAYATEQIIDGASADLGDERAPLAPFDEEGDADSSKAPMLLTPGVLLDISNRAIECAWPGRDAFACKTCISPPAEPPRSHV